MKKVSADLIKQLREKTSASVFDCKKALEESGTDLNKAVEYLRRHGRKIAAQKEGRLVKEGRIEAYVHLGNKIGVLLEVDCETDFVARNSEFCQFTKDLAMQIAACNPLYIKKEDVPAEILKKEKNPQEFYKTHCLLEQPFVKDLTITVKDYLGSMVARIGENILIRRFTRYKVGE